MVNNYTPKLKRTQVGKLPRSPGVYMFKKGAKLLYVGKAANLRERIKQHKDLLKRVKKVRFIETGSEIEALILEANLIKKYKPKYNVLWKDDKNFFFVAITKENMPRVFITHQPELKTTNYKLETNYVGPFVDGKALKQTLKYLRKSFSYYSVKKHPKNLCPWCHLNLCPGPNPEPKEYQENIKNLIKILKGKKKSVLRRLKKEMVSASKRKDFEKAAKFRDQINSLEKVFSHARIFERPEALLASKPQLEFNGGFERIEGYDVSNIQGKFATGAMVVFTKGLPNKSEYRKFKIRRKKQPSDTAMLKEVLTRRLKHAEWPLPNLILVDGGKAQLQAARRVAGRFKLNVQIIALSKDKRHRGHHIFLNTKKKPLLLKNMSPALRNLILRVDDEAHRFALTYHRKLRRVDLLAKF